jgi:Zn-dependent protease
LDFPLAYPLTEIPYIIIALMLALTIHEFSHAYVAYLFGDPTAKNEGRLTLNPLAHLDILGTIFIFIAGFGWAKPVPVNRNYFKNPRLASVLTSVAGPFSNLLLAFISLIIWYSLRYIQIEPSTYNIFHHLFVMIIQLNVVLFIFNLLPFPPLEGYRVIEDLVPYRLRLKISQYEYVGIIIFLVLAISPLGEYVFKPLFRVAVPYLIDWMQAVVLMIFS